MAISGRSAGLLAGLAVAGAGLAIAGPARAQPIVSPRQLSASPVTAGKASQAARPAAPRKAATAAPAAKTTATAKPASSRKAAAAAKTKARAAKTKAAAAKTKAATGKPTRVAAKSAKATAKSGKPRTAKPRAVAAASGRARRGDNMPVGFDWPPTPGMTAAAAACKADLAALGVGWTQGAPEGRIAAPIELTSATIAGVTYMAKWRRPPHTLDCHLARALAHVSPTLHAIGVREVRFGSIFRWTNVRTGGQELPFLSRHALGLAMDIVEFIDDSGRIANVEQHYQLDDPLLLAIEEAFNASGKFRIVLTPRNDPQSHHDHFHIEANPSYTSR